MNIKEAKICADLLIDANWVKNTVLLLVKFYIGFRLFLSTDKQGQAQHLSQQKATSMLVWYVSHCQIEKCVLCQ